MADCTEYLELISRSIDGDLSAEEAEQLYEHLAHCPSCSETLSSFEELSMMTSDSTKTPPTQLREGVMASIKAAKKLPWHVKYRFTAVAACFALVVLAISYTPLGDLLTPPQEDEVFTEQTADSSIPETVMRAMPTSDSEIKTAETPQIAKSVVPQESEEELLADSADAEAQPAENTGAPLTEAVQENSAADSASETVETPSFDPSLLPQTPYPIHFAKYLMFEAKEAPAVLYDITSDQTIDRTVYYIVTQEQFTAVQSALLENGIEVEVLPGDPTVTDHLLILTIAE